MITNNKHYVILRAHLISMNITVELYINESHRSKLIARRNLVGLLRHKTTCDNESQDTIMPSVHRVAIYKVKRHTARRSK